MTPLSYTMKIVLNGATTTQVVANQNQYQDWHVVIGDDGVNVQHDVAGLEAAGLVPPYDLTMGVNTASGSVYAADVTTAATAGFGQPLATNGVLPGMNTTGGRPDIGVTTGAIAIWLRTQDDAARRFALAQADTGGSVPWHFWDALSGRWMDAVDHPNLWATGKDGQYVSYFTTAMPPQDTNNTPSRQPWDVATSHAPNLDFVPALLTGSRYYRDMQQAQAMGSLLICWPPQRGAQQTPSVGDQLFGNTNGDGSTGGLEVRSIAWTYRENVEAWALASSGSVPLAHLAKVLADSWSWWNSSAAAPAWTAAQGSIGTFVPGRYTSAIMPPWEQDYLELAVGMGALLGDPGAVAAEPTVASSRENGAVPQTGYDPANSIEADWEYLNGTAAVTTWAGLQASQKAQGWPRTPTQLDGFGDYDSLLRASLAMHLRLVPGDATARAGLAGLLGAVTAATSNIGAATYQGASTGGGLVQEALALPPGITGDASWATQEAALAAGNTGNSTTTVSGSSGLGPSSGTDSSMGASSSTTNNSSGSGSSTASGGAGANNTSVSSSGAPTTNQAGSMRTLGIADDPTYPYGSPTAIAQRLALYKALGVTTIPIECGWSDSETSPGVWRNPTWLPYMRAVIAAGFTVDLTLETISAPPDWFFAANPGAHLVDQSGQVGTHALSYWWPGLPLLMQQKTEAVLALLAQAGVLGSVRTVGVSLGTATEPLYPAQWTLPDGAAAPTMWYYDANARADFPVQMQAQYRTLAALNAAWGTGYAQWSQVRLPDPGTVRGPMWADVLSWYRNAKRKFISAQVMSTVTLLRQYAPAGHVPQISVAIPGDHIPAATWNAAVSSGSGSDQNIVIMPDSEFLLDLASRTGAVAHFIGMPDTEELQYLQQYITAHGYHISLYGENAGFASVVQNPVDLANQAFYNGLAGYVLNNSSFLLNADNVTPNALYATTQTVDARLLAAWKSGAMSPLPLPTNFSLIAGGCITVDSNQKIQLCLSTKGQLTIMRSTASLWAANTAPRNCDLTQSWINGCHLTAQGDGNLVLYNGSSPYWATNTNGAPAQFVLSNTPPYLTVQNAQGVVIWSSDTSR